MKLTFLGTGAADWSKPNADGEYRRFTSTLLDNCLLIDVTRTVLDRIGNTDAITDVFFTHSHSDHFDLEALKKLAPCRVWAHESLAHEIKGEKLAVSGLQVGKPVETAGFTVLPMPANHSTDKKYETALHYLIRRGEKLLLYATDGAWLLNGEHHLIGKQQLDAAVFDATIGDDCDGDWRIFEHNSVDMLRLMVKTMQKTGRLKPDAPAFMTHFARTLHPSQAELEARTEPPFVACYDGMETEI